MSHSTSLCSKEYGQLTPHPPPQYPFDFSALGGVVHGGMLPCEVHSSSANICAPSLRC